MMEEEEEEEEVAAVQTFVRNLDRFPDTITLFVKTNEPTDKVKL